MTTIEKQEQNSAVQFATNMRVHLSLNTANLERAIKFYSVLFGQEPTKIRPGYAKFEVAEPPVNLTLNEQASLQAGGTLSHLGIQVKSTEEVLAAKNRFIASQLATFEEEQVTCCYAVQDKVWVTDPDSNSWEVFVVLEADAPVHSVNRPTEADAQTCCAPQLGDKKTLPFINMSSSGGGSCC